MDSTERSVLVTAHHRVGYWLADDCTTGGRFHPFQGSRRVWPGSIDTLTASLVQGQQQRPCSPPQHKASLASESESSFSAASASPDPSCSFLDCSAFCSYIRSFDFSFSWIALLRFFLSFDAFNPWHGSRDCWIYSIPLDSQSIHPTFLPHTTPMQTYYIHTYKQTPREIAIPAAAAADPTLTPINPSISHPIQSINQDHATSTIPVAARPLASAASSPPSSVSPEAGVRYSSGTMTLIVAPSVFCCTYVRGEEASHLIRWMAGLTDPTLLHHTKRRIRRHQDERRAPSVSSNHRHPTSADPPADPVHNPPNQPTNQPAPVSSFSSPATYPPSQSRPA